MSEGDAQDTQSSSQNVQILKLLLHLLHKMKYKQLVENVVALHKSVNNVVYRNPKKELVAVHLPAITNTLLQTVIVCWQLFMHKQN